MATEDEFDESLEGEEDGDLDLDDDDGDVELDDDIELDDDLGIEDGYEETDTEPAAKDGDNLEPEIEEEEEEVEEEEEEDLDEDVEDETEESLEVLLGTDHEDEVEITGETRGGLTKAAHPIGEGEFTCRSCFLVKRRAQLADAKKLICLDCA